MTDPVRPGPPPFGGSWRRLYAGVAVWLVVLILLFWAFTAEFAP